MVVGIIGKTQYSVVKYISTGARDREVEREREGEREREREREREKE